MMKISASYKEIYNELYKLDKNILIRIGNIIKNLNIDKVLSLEEGIYRCFYSESYLYTISKQRIKIYNERFDELNNIIILEAEGIIIFGINDYIIRIEEDLEDYYLIFENNVLVKKEKLFYGGYYNKFRIEYKKEQDTLAGFVISNLLDTETYFEYNCERGEEIAGEIIKYKEKIIFYTREREKELYVSKFWINVLDIKTGAIIYKIIVQQYGACFDYKTGQFASIQGSNQNNEIIKRYEIVDVNNGRVDKGNFNFQQEMFAVGTAVQYINNNKLYFADNIYSYKEQKIKSPKIGCFDIKTKKVDFLEEIPELDGSKIAQIICNDEKLYVKSSDGDLIVYAI